jgi:magnesium-transporting ATPase (P-type)
LATADKTGTLTTNQMTVINLWVFHRTIRAANVIIADNNDEESSSSTAIDVKAEPAPDDTSPVANTQEMVADTGNSATRNNTIPSTLIEAAALNSNVYSVSEMPPLTSISPAVSESNVAQESKCEESKESDIPIEQGRNEVEANALNQQTKTILKGVSDTLTKLL